MSEPKEHEKNHYASVAFVSDIWLRHQRRVGTKCQMRYTSVAEKRAVPDRRENKAMLLPTPNGPETQLVKNFGKKRPPRKGGWKRFYVFDVNLKYRGDDITLISSPQILAAINALGRQPPVSMPAEPIKIDIKTRRNSTALLDINRAPHGLFYISDRLKIIIETVDPSACAFTPCETTIDSIQSPDTYWLCNISQRRAAFDEEFSNFAKMRYPDREWEYRVGYPRPFHIQDDLVGDAHLFRLTLPCQNVSHQAFCDDAMRDACKAAGVIGIDFRRIDKV